MSPEDLAVRLRPRPFVPFRIVVAGGAAYAVYRPEHVMIGSHAVLIGLAKPGEPFCEGTVSVDLADILRFEPLDAPGKDNAMRPDDLLTWLRAAPFRPFRVTLNSGRSYDIRHPEMMKIGRTTAAVFHYAAEPSGPYEGVEMVSLLLMERVEPLEAPATTGDGAAGA